VSRTTYRVLGLLAFFAFALGTLVFLVQRVGTQVIPRDRYVVEAHVPDAVALGNAADVRQAGVKIGRVQDIKNAGNLIALRLEIDPKYGPFYRNATTLVRAKSIAEENYVEIDPGSPQAGAIPQNGVIGISRNLEATQNDDFFSIFNKVRRQNLRGVLAGASAGLEGEGGRDLNDTLGAMTHVVDSSDEFARVLAQQRTQVARLVDSFGVVTAALGERADAIRTLTTSAKAEAEAVAARDAGLKATLAALPPLLAQGRKTAGRLQGFSTRATPVMNDLGAATRALVPTVRDLGPAATQGRRALRSLARFASAGTPMVRALPPFAAALTRFTPAYEDFLRSLNPVVDYIRPYYREAGSWFSLAGAAVQVKDSVGHVARVLLPLSRSSLPGSLPPDVEEVVKRFSGGLDSRGSNAFPKPGTVANPVPGDGSYTRLTPDPAYTNHR
jgi:phospholipid/cholesterol/gamma-HCH transport system substrate-binding protein